MSLSVLDAVISAYNQNKPVAKYITLVSNDLDFYINQDKFYKLPSSFILSVVKKTDNINPQWVSSIAKRIPDIQSELIKYAKIDDSANLSEIISAISSFNEIPILSLIAEKYRNEEQLVDRDWKYSFEEINSKYKMLSEEHEKEKQISTVMDEVLSFADNVINAHKNKKYVSTVKAEDIEDLIAGITKKPHSVEEAENILSTLKRKHESLTGMPAPPEKLKILSKEEIKHLTYDQAMTNLEEAISQLETMPLHDSTEGELYEYAINLREYCNTLLKNEKESIIRIARENNIPLSEIGLSDE